MRHVAFGTGHSLNDLAEHYVGARQSRLEYETENGYTADTPPHVLVQRGIKRGVELLHAYRLRNRLLEQGAIGATIKGENYDNWLPQIAEGLIEGKK